MYGQLRLIDNGIQEALCENEAFLTQQLITYIGNKRSLLDFIGEGVKRVQNKLHKEKLTMFDVFSGSGIVSRYFKKYSDLLIVNDLEKYSTLINQCYLSNGDDLNIAELRKLYTEITHCLNNEKLIKGLISGLYAPRDEKNIQPEDRVFYTVRNAMYIDTARQLIDSIPAQYKKYFIAPLLSEASIHANTSGVFKGFYKNKENGIGQFGGKNRDALFRITGNIVLPFPVFSNYYSDALICNGDSNIIINTVPEADIAYLDPPYNQHPYGSNYFMLNLILDYKYPESTSKISGIPENWNRSNYNKENHALASLTELVTNIKAKFVLISFNSEGFIGLDEMKTMLNKIGKVEVLETKYNTFRGSRNLDNRDIHVKEYLYLLEK
ncbi:DNA adenine methylase [Treponema primitia]|uniref:DNA adenine methylase n=1 Tax=Treponema primitia TaxID=88058 RepID=UPI00397F7D31